MPPIAACDWPITAATAQSCSDHYYDQSHFLRDFKRFTGLTPSIYAATPDYGRFYIPG